MEKSLTANLLAIIKRHRWKYATGLMYILFASFLLVFNPLLFRQALVALHPEMGQEKGYLASFSMLLPESLYHSLAFWVLSLILVSILSNVFRIRMRKYFFYIAGETEKEVRHKLYQKFQTQSMAFFDRHGTGELVSRLTNDMGAYRDVLGQGIMFPTYFATTVIPGFIILATISKELTLIALIPIFILPLFHFVIRKPVHSLSHKVQEGLADLSNMAQEHYSGIKIVKSYSIEDYTTAIFLRSCKKLSFLSRRLASLLGVTFPFFYFITRSVNVFFLLGAAWMITSGNTHLHAADFLAFMWLQSYIFFPILMLGWVIPMYAKGRAAYERICEVYNEPIEVADKGEAGLAITPMADILIKDLTFTYPGASRPALNQISLQITGGTFIGVTGPIGGGKSTLFKILNREYEIPHGKVRIGGHDIRDYSLSSFREAIVTVEQVPFLFSKTIGENVLFGKEEATRDELEMAANSADLHETIMEFPDAYDTLVGERGVTLSGGQKQRVAMARAFIVDRSILLLDDIFSAVDAGTEKRIFDSMYQKFRGKTLILITHRVSLLLKMDRVIYIQDGSILEDGPPEELVKKGGRFSALAQLQRWDANG